MGGEKRVVDLVVDWWCYYYYYSYVQARGEMRIQCKLQHDLR